MQIFRLLDESSVVTSYHVLDFKKWHDGYYFKISIVLVNDNQLFIREYSDQTERNYAYHWQDDKGNLIVRWDNAPHYKDMVSFPHHKHLGDSIEESQEITLKDVLDVITKKIHSK